MASVNPPPLRVPKSILGDAETAGFFLELLTVIRQLWTRTGGGTDLVIETSHFSALPSAGAGVELSLSDLAKHLAQAPPHSVIDVTPIRQVSPPPIVQEPIRAVQPPLQNDALMLSVVTYGPR